MAHVNEEAIKSLYPDVLVVEADGKAYVSSGVEKTVDADAVALKKVQLKRATAYPSLQEQMDMQYWDSVNGTTTWKDAIAKVKSDYPKPS
tara:strand:+ start:225 stop:494 length:270 start_codon:yes stop_codon:yes gene_type:complete